MEFILTGLRLSVEPSWENRAKSSRGRSDSDNFRYRERDSALPSQEAIRCKAFLGSDGLEH